MKVTTEKLPNSVLALDIELDRGLVEKGLERAARRLSQKYTIPGFRKGKAPRFIVENYFGRPALLEEASEDLVNNAFKTALEQEQIEPIGQASLEHIHLDSEPFTFRVTVPVPPTVILPDYRAIRSPLTIDEVTDETVEQALNARRDRHAVLRDLEEPRPAQDGDQLTVELDALVDGEPIEPRAPGEPIPPSTLVLEKDRLADGLYDGLIGLSEGQFAQVLSHMPADHSNEKLRDKDVTFNVRILKIQERLLPDWDELPVLEEFDGTLDELREKTRGELIEAARASAESKAIDGYVRQLVEQTSFDIPEVMIEREADRLVHQQEAEYTRYGIKPEQVYEMRGQKREEIVESMKPQAEQRLKTTLALQEIVTAEGLQLSEEEINEELERMVGLYGADQQEQVRETLSRQLRSMVLESALDKKLRARVLAIATGAAEEAEADAPVAEGDTPSAAEVAEVDAPVAEGDTPSATEVAEADAPPQSDADAPAESRPS